MRGGSWNNHRDNARCGIRNRNHPDNRNDNIGFRVVLRSSHVLPPLLLVPPPGGTVRRHHHAARVPEMPADPRQRLCRPRRRKKNSARPVWSARRPQGRATAGHCPRRAHREARVRPGQQARRTRPDLPHAAARRWQRAARQPPAQPRIRTHRPRDRRVQLRCRCDRTRSGESSRRAGDQSRRRCGSRARTDHCPANPTAVPGAGRAAAC